jgi:CBS domain containing-hemolysin-like protein
MSDYSTSSNGERQELSWFDRLAAKLGFAPSIDARTVIEEALADDEGRSFSAAEQAMLQKALRFKSLRAEDMCLPRAAIMAVEDCAALGDLIGIFSRTGFSRVPVYHDTLDNPLGMVHVKDAMSWIFARLQAQPPAGVAGGLSADDLAIPVAATGLIREAIFAPPSMSALDLLVKMQSHRIHLALIIDEYGGTDGLVTLEDLLEEIFGDIADEHDIHQPLIAEDAGGLVADARAEIEDVEAKIGRSLVSAEGEDVETLGGLVFTMLGRVPVRGEIVCHPSGFEFEILDADRRRVKKLKVRLPEGTHTHAA